MDTRNRKVVFTVKPLAAAVAVAACVPGLASAQPLEQAALYNGADMTRYSTNNIELGIGYNDCKDDCYAFGKWTGLYKTDPFFIGNFNYAQRDNASASYANAWGWNLGLPTLQAGASGGTQGKWGLGVSYSQITNYTTDTGSYIYNGLGSNSLTLPSGFQGIGPTGNSQPPANAAKILPYEQGGYGVKYDHDFLTFTGEVGLGKGWDVTAKYNYQTRDGTALTGAAIGNSGGNPRSAILPYPIDDNTQQIEVALRYQSEKLQFNVSYWYSKYSNSIDSFTWQNAYLNQPTGLWQANSGVGFSTGFGRMSLMPDNDFNQIQATGAYDFTPTTRLTATFVYGVGKQDQSYLPYTINQAPLVTPGLNVPYALPQSSLGGEIRNTLFDVTLTSRPIDKLKLRLNYHYNEHDNQTPENQYIYVGGDSLNQPTITGSAATTVANQIRINLPPGTTENKFVVDADYALMRGASLRAWYQYLKTDYKVAADELRSDTNVNQFGVQLRSRGNEVAQGYVKYTYDQRRGSDFEPNQPYQASYTPATVAANRYDNVPTLRHYYVADYDQNAIQALVGLTPSAPVAVQLRADWWQREYKGPDCGGPNDQLAPSPFVFPAQCQGRTKAQGQSYTIDGQFMPSSEVSLYAFYTWSQFATDQAARSWSGGASTGSTSTDPQRNWWADLKDTENTVGAGLKWTPRDKPYDAGVQYVYNQGVTTTDVSIASPPTPLTMSPVPDSKYTMNSVQVYGKWQYSKNLLFRANYWYQQLKGSDWRFDNGTPVTSNNVLLTGQSTPHYTANVFGISVAYTGF